MNEQQLQDLYEYLKSIGQHGGIDYDGWVGQLNPQSVTNLHRNMSQAGILPPDVDADRFQSDIFGGVEDYKKKRTSQAASVPSSASSGSGSPATASANAQPADTNTKPTDWNTAPLLTDPMRSEAADRRQEPDLTGLPTIPRFDGTEDPLEAGKAVMKVKEQDFDTKEKLATSFGKGQRDMEAIAAYGQRLNLQATSAKNDLSLLYGQDWEGQLEKAAKVIETGDPTQDPEGFNAAKDFLSNVLESEPYKVLQGAQLGYEKSKQAFVDYEKNNPGYAQRIKEGKAAQSVVDAQSLWTDPYFMNKRIARWYGRKTAEVGASVLSLPRTLAGALPEGLNEAIRSTGGFGMSDFLGKLGDMATETVDIYLPKPTGLKRPLYEKSATVNVGGKTYEAVLDGTGAVSKVYSTLPNGNAVEATPNESEMAEIVAQAPALARDKFTGIDNTASKAFDVAADLAIARFLGGGSAARAGIASFAQVHNDYYQEAIKDMNMSASDAAQYAMTAAAVNAAFEAGVGNIESGPFGAIAKTNPALNSMSKMQARAVVGKMSPGQVAIARLKPLVTDIAGENAEELLQSIGDSAVAATFNEMTGSTLETGITANEIKEQMLLTTIVTGVLGGGGSGQMAQYQKTALGAAVANPERFAGAMSALVDEGVITPEEAQGYQFKVEGLNAKWNNLPAGLDDGAKTDIIVLQNARDEMQRAIDSGAVVEAQAEQYKGQIKQIDSTIQSLLKPAMQPQAAPEEAQPAPAEVQAEVAPGTPVEEAVPEAVTPEVTPEQPMVEPDFSLPITIKPPAQSTVEPVEVKQAVRRAKQSGTPLPETLDEIVERDNTPISTVQQVIEQARTVPNFGDSLAEHYVDEVTQAVMDQTARFHNVSPDEFTSVRQKVAEELPMAPADAGFQDVIDAISRKYVDDRGGLGSEQKPLNVQMDIETVDDAIADFFASGGRLRKSGADWMMSKGVQQDQKGAMLLYFSDKSTTGMDQLAQDLADRFNMSEADANQAIADFVNSNPYGPGDYMRGRIETQKGIQPEMQEEVAPTQEAQPQPQEIEPEAPAEITSNEINAEVDTFLSRFDKDGDFDVDAALEAIEGFDPEFLNLSPEAQTAIEDAVKSIRTTAEEQGPVEQTGRGREEEIAEPATTAAPVNEQQPTTDVAPEGEVGTTWQEISNVADPVELNRRIDELPVDQSTAVIDAGIAIENNAPDDLISALQELATNGTPLTAEQEAQVRELRKEVKPDQDINPDSVAPTPDVQFQADRMIVRNADMFSDAMMAAGGVWSNQQQAWVFPKNKELQVRKILASRNPAMTATMDAAGSVGAEGFSLRQTLRNGLSAPKVARTLDKVAKAKGIADKTRQLMSELNPTRKNPAREMRRVMRRLKQAFPNTEIVTDPAKIDAILKKHGVTEAVKGFVYEGKVYIDTRTAGLDTPIHEFGHIWTAWLKETNPEHYQAGLELMRGTMYERMIRSIPLYDGLSDEAILEEALATAIGEQGFRMETSSAWAKFKKWLMGLFAAHDRQRGFSPEGMTASQYAEYVAGELTRGKLIDQSQQRLDEIRDSLGDAPKSVPTEDGIQFQFVGQKADMGPQAFTMLEMAKSLEQRGKSPEDIWDASGWYRGVDGIWRYEINSDDVTAKIYDGEAAIEMQDRLGRPLMLSDIADHPTIFAAYPDIAETEVRVEPMTGKVAAWIKTENGKTVLGISDTAQLLPSTLVHEIQHIIQIKEGFAGGMSQQDAGVHAIIHIHMLSKQYEQLMADGHVGRAKAVAEQLSAIMRHRVGAGLDPSGIYKATAGEVEARLAEQRREQMIPSPGYTIADAPSIVYRGIEYFFKPTWFDPERHIFTTPEQVQAAFEFDAPVPMADRKSIPPFIMYDVAPEEQILFDSTGETRAFFESRPEGLFQFHASATAASLATRQLAASDMVIDEITREGQTNALSKITKIATDNFLDRNEVAKMWEAESQRAGFGRLDYTKKEAAFKPEALNLRIMKWVKKWFYSSGLLGPELKGEVERMEHNIAALTYRMDLAIKDFDRAVDAEIKKWPDKDKAQARLTFRQIADNVMKGDADFTALPEGMREPVLAMRKIVDNLSREIIKIGAGNHKMWVSILQNSGVQVEFAGAIEKSEFEMAIKTSPNDRTAEQNAAIEAFLDGYGTKLGTYLYRSYQVNDDKNWREKVDKGVLSRATAKIESMIRTRIAELEQIQQMAAQEIQDDIDANKAKINNIVSALQSSMADAQKRVDELLAEQAQYQKDKGRTNLRIQASIRAAANVLKEASAKYRQANAMADEDIVMIQTMPSDEFNQMRLQAKTVAALRKKNHELFDTMLEVIKFSPKEIEHLNARLNNIDGIVNEILDRPKPPEGIVKKGMPGSKDLSQFTGRKEIPEEIRDLMGEYRDARINFGKSVAKMAQLLESQKLLLRLRQQYAGKFFFPPGTPTPTHFREIAAEGSEAMSPLNGWYTSPDIYEALQDTYSKASTDKTLKAWLGFVSYVRYGKTVLSPVTHVRNVVSNLYLSAVHGHFDITNPARGFGFRDAFSVVKDKMYLMGDDQRRDEVDKLVSLGIIDSGTSSEILKKGLEEMQAGGADWDLSSGRLYEWETGTIPQRLKAKGIKGIKSITNFAEEAYRQEDNFFKVMGFYSEQNRYAKVLFNKKYDELTPAQAQAVDQKAADIVRDILPTYDKVPRVVSKFLRTWPLTGTFVAFPAEMFRTTKNTIMLSVEEMRDPRTRSMGFIRLARFTAMQSIIMYASYFTKELAGIDDEEEEALRRFAKPWQSLGTFLYHKPKPGEYNFTNLSYTDPHAWFKKVWWRMATGSDKNVGERAVLSFLDMLQPFTEENLVLGSVRQLAQNQNEQTGQRIYRPNMLWTEFLPVKPTDDGVRMGRNFQDVWRFMTWQLQPGFVKTKEDFQMAITGESIGGRTPKDIDQAIASVFGFQNERIVPDIAFGQKTYLHSVEKNDLRSIFTEKVKEVARQSKNNLIKKDQALAQLNEAYDICEVSTLNYCEKILKDIERAETLGVSRQSINDELKKKGFSKYERSMLLSGKPFKPLFEGYNK